MAGIKNYGGESLVRRVWRLELMFWVYVILSTIGKVVLHWGDIVSG